MYLLLESGPGSGKSHTLLKAFEYLQTRTYNGFIPTQEQTTICYTIGKSFPTINPTQVVFLAFNRDICDYLTKQLPATVKSYTFNGCGQSRVIQRHGPQPLDHNRGDKLLSNILGQDLKDLSYPLRKQFYLMLRYITALKEELLTPSPENLLTVQLKYGFEQLALPTTATQQAFSSSVKSLPQIAQQPLPLTKLQTTQPPNQTNHIHDIISLMTRLMQIMSIPNKRTFPHLPNSIEFIDQVWMGLQCLDKPVYELGFVDEAQDLSRLRLEFCLALCKNVIFCGDPYQSINAFAGADFTAFETLRSISKYHLPLKTCFRCPPNHIEEANRIRPARITPFKKENGPIERISLSLLGQRIHQFSNPKIFDVNTDEANVNIITTNSPYFPFRPPYDSIQLPECASTLQNHLLLARTNATLFKVGISLLKQRLPASIVRRSGDKDIETVLLKYFEASRCTSLPALQSKMQADISKSEQMPFKQGSVLQEKASCILYLTKEVDNINQIPQLIRSLCSHRDGSVRLCTAHKSKGLEAPFVYILFPPIPHPKATSPSEIEQERNLQFVTETRSSFFKAYVIED